MTWLRPLPRAWARGLSGLVLVLWVAQMGVLARHVLAATSLNLAADLARYTQEAQWRGVYYRGEKIGFTVGQTRQLDEGFELQEDSQLQLLLLGSSSTVRVSTRVVADASFEVQSFRFSLDPGTGPMTISGRVEGTRLVVAIESRSGRREEVRDLPERPVLSLNLPRRLAALGMEAGKHYRFTAFDPATLRNAPMELDVQAREVVWLNRRPMPAFKVRLAFQGVNATAWITDVGEILKEESPLGLLTVRETREQALDRSMSQSIRADLLEAAAVPTTGLRLDEAAVYDRLTLRLDLPADFDAPDLEGEGQTRSGSDLTVLSARRRAAGKAPANLADFLAPEALIESDAPEIVAEAERVTRSARTPRERAELLSRHVNTLIEKRPTVSLPSAVEVLRTRVGDCNEHTALLVALARAVGLPARIDVGLVHLRGAFYYHAWAELWIEESEGQGLWVPVDPTLGQFPADPGHVRLVRGGLESQTRIVPLLGRARIVVLAADRRADAAPQVLVGETRADRAPAVDLLQLPQPTGGRKGCWSSPSK